jgi:antitoxin (DNA-binding transcriptional repressor) of toxin-antitoxin stability system
MKVETKMETKTAPKTIDVAEARAHFDEILSCVAEGTEIIIEKDKKPVARMVPVAPPPPRPKKRKLGSGRGEVWMSEDFDEPLPAEFWLGEE